MHHKVDSALWRVKILAFCLPNAWLLPLVGERLFQARPNSILLPTRCCFLILLGLDLQEIRSLGISNFKFHLVYCLYGCCCILKPIIFEAPCFPVSTLLTFDTSVRSWGKHLSTLQTSILMIPNNRYNFTLIHCYHESYSW